MENTNPFLVERMQAHRTSIFGRMSGLANEFGAINLGQGFPDTDGPEFVRQAAIDAISEGRGNQYPPVHGVPELRQAIASHQQSFYDMDVDWQTEVVVTTGASEALQSTFLALIEPGDEVLIFEPWFDIYQTGVALARGITVGVPMDPETLRPNVSELESRITSRSKVLLLNSPHNPTGIVFTRTELQTIAATAIKHNLIVVSDEAYQHIWFDNHAHIPIATLEGMHDRTVTIGSAGKSFSFTGWKVGWAIGPSELIAAVRTVRQHLTYVSSGPFQWAIAEGLQLEDSYWSEFRTEMQAKRDLLSSGLSHLGYRVIPSEGTYFVCTDIRPLGYFSGTEFCETLIREHGVAAIPLSGLSGNASTYNHFVRWAFCKKPEVLNDALSRLAKKTVT